MNTLILLCSFLAAGGFALSLVSMAAGYANRRRVMLANYSEYERSRIGDSLGRFKPFLQDIVGYLNRIPVFNRWAGRAEGPLRLKLRKAGDPGGLAPREFLATKIVLPLVTLFLCYLCVPSEYFPFALFMVLVSVVLPDSWLRDRMKARMQSIQRGLPDALDTFSLIMKAGLDLGRAIDTYVQVPKRSPLMDEFYLMRAEMRLGKPRGEAMFDMASRLGIPDLNNLATAVVQSEQTGVSMADFLAGQAEELRVKRFQMAEEQAQKAPVKLMLPLMLFVMPCVFLVLLAPMAINYYQGGGN